MDNMINVNQPVNQVLKTHPELLDILVELGFKPLANPLMRQSLGHITTLKQGCQLINLPIDQLKTTLHFHGYDVTD